MVTSSQMKPLEGGGTLGASFMDSSPLLFDGAALSTEENLPYWDLF